MPNLTTKEIKHLKTQKTQQRGIQHRKEEFKGEFSASDPAPTDFQLVRNLVNSLQGLPFSLALIFLSDGGVGFPCFYFHPLCKVTNLI